jgi:large subunit ribosomal protein L18
MGACVSFIQEAAAKVGELIAERAASSNVTAVHWARKQGQRYHGKIASLLQSMQAAGLPLH